MMIFRGKISQTKATSHENASMLYKKRQLYHEYSIANPCNRKFGDKVQFSMKLSFYRIATVTINNP